MIGQLRTLHVLSGAAPAPHARRLVNLPDLLLY